MNAIPSELDDHRYWKAAISHLPTQPQRDAAWEFFINRFVGNPNAADTISGIVLVMEAHGLYMLALPRKFHEEAVTPLEAAMGRFHEDSQKLLVQQAEANKAILEACEKAHQTAESATTSIAKLDDAIRNGWQEVKTEKLAERIHEEMKITLLRPLADQCRQLEEATPAIKDAIDQLENSARKLRAFHFRGILAGMIISFIVITGGYSWMLTKEHERKLHEALENLEQTESYNREAFRKLDLLGAKIRVADVTDNRGKAVNDNYALVLEAGYDVIIRDSQKGKEAGILFRSLDIDEGMQKFFREQSNR